MPACIHKVAVAEFKSTARVVVGGQLKLPVTTETPAVHELGETQGNFGAGGFSIQWHIDKDITMPLAADQRHFVVYQQGIDVAVSVGEIRILVPGLLFSSA